MAQSKNRLGRGLGGLISGGGVAQAKKAQETVSPATKAKATRGKSTSASKDSVSGVVLGLGYQEITLGKIKANPYQPRRNIAEKQVEELARSIKSEGLLQPIVVRSIGKGYELIAGERRLRAFKFLKSKTIPCRVIEASDASSASLALIENLQRENLNPIDEALGYASLVRDFDLTQEAAADRVGKGRATVANALRLLSLSDEIQGFLSRRLLSTGHAKALLGVKDDAQKHLLARRIIESNLSVREAEKIVKRLNEGLEPFDGSGSGKEAGGKANGKQAENTAIADLEKRIEKHFNTNVSIQHGKKKGKLVIEYFGNEDLDRLLELLGINQR
ncbi:MAG: ParB/RepB/Spo0J family partition protein [Coraliomargaritaceae bacterium]